MITIPELRGKDIIHSNKKGIVHSLGCKVSQVETESVAQLMRDAGYELSDRHKDPDLIFVNTCCVTGRAEAKSRRFVGSLAKRFPSARIIAAGCLAELKPDNLQALSPNIACLGTYAKDCMAPTASIFEYNDGLHTGISASGCGTFGFLPTPTDQNRARALIKIQDGCSQRCSYCIVPTTRGPSRSMEPDRALEDISRLEIAGFPEIVLTGIHLGAYGRDLSSKIGFDDFVEKALGILVKARLRFSSIEPQEVSDKLIEIVAADSRICNHFHIPVQNMDDRILVAMGRPYSSRQIEELAARILGKIPDACIGADVMVGFPGEDDHSFKITYDSLARSGFGYLHVFPFSRRPGVPASTMIGVPDRKVVAERVTAMRLLSERLRNTFYARFVGRELQACIESGQDSSGGYITARTDNYILARLIDAAGIPRRGLFKIVVESVSDELALAKPA